MALAFSIQKFDKTHFKKLSDGGNNVDVCEAQVNGDFEVLHDLYKNRDLLHCFLNVVKCSSEDQYSEITKEQLETIIALVNKTEYTHWPEIKPQNVVMLNALLTDTDFNISVLTFDWNP